MLDVKKINTKPELDPWQRDTGQPSHTVMALDPEAGIIYVDQEYQDNSTSAYRWHGREQTWRIYTWPSEADMRAFIEDHMPQFERIVAGYECRWDGSNHVGVWLEDAQIEIERIQRDLDHLELYWEWWDTAEWCQHGMSVIIAELDDDALAGIAEDWEDVARVDHVVLDEPILDYLKRYRDEQRLELEDA